MASIVARPPALGSERSRYWVSPPSGGSPTRGRLCSQGMRRTILLACLHVPSRTTRRIGTACKCSADKEVASSLGKSSTFIRPCFSGNQGHCAFSPLRPCTSTSLPDKQRAASFPVLVGLRASSRCNTKHKRVKGRSRGTSEQMHRYCSIVQRPQRICALPRRLIESTAGAIAGLR